MRRQYPFHLIEPKWQQFWEQQQTFRAWNPGDVIPQEHPFAERHGLGGKSARAEHLPPKFYILDMFPYPSGAGLHVGHPEGYTATDILSRYRRSQGYNVLHPMGWDSFGLPAEQYAVKTGQHPRKTTNENIANFTKQIKSLGFSYDWTRELATTDPEYFKWTQWIFLKLYNSWFNPETNKAEPIEMLEYPPELQVVTPSLPSDGGEGRGEEADLNSKTPLLNPLLTPASQGEEEEVLSAKRRAFRDSKRLAFVSDAPVNWCPELGTVLANEEVIDGKSEVGGFPVVRKPMRQWMLRITAFAERLLNDLEGIDWSHSLKEMQRNWIGKSEGAEVKFLHPETGTHITVFTTRPDTLFGATYMVLSPEHPLIERFTPEGYSETVRAYQIQAAQKSDLDRTDLGKNKTGVFTGAFAINPVNGQEIPIWIADYVLATYGTGAIMAVPAHDERDFEFAKKYSLPIRPVVAPTDAALRSQTPKLLPPVADQLDLNSPKPPLIVNRGIEDLRVAFSSEFEKAHEAFVAEGVTINSANAEISLDGLPTPEAKKKITDWLEAKGLGKKTINYKLRDWLFSRQRYWGEPFPIVWKRSADGNLYHEALPESALPVLPPELTDYKPTSSGEPPLARAKDWVTLPDGSIRETNTMPQWAGSCWYYLRYQDAKNEKSYCDKTVENYWMGTAAVAAVSARRTSEEKITGGQRPPLQTPGVDLYVGGTEHAVLHLLYSRFWHKVLFDLGYVSTKEPFYKLVNQGLILGEDGQKMSKSRGNVVNPDDVLKEYGADAFRLYEMFMGPLEMVKPWNTKGVEGVYRFLGRVWRLFVDEKSEVEFEQASTTENENASLLEKIQISAAVKNVDATPAQLKTLHACIKKVTEDLDAMRFNTAISALMVFVNEAITWETKPVSVLRDFLLLLQPFSPHIAEELWDRMNSAFKTQNSSLSYTPWPKYEAALLVESTLEIPVQVNGKLRDVIVVAATATQEEIEKAALASEKVQQFLTGKTIKKIIVVPKKLVNIAAG